MAIDRGVDNYIECRVVGGFMGPLGFPFSTINVSADAVEFQMVGDGVNAAYGMPTFQFYDAVGTLVAQTQASAIDYENGSWAKGWSYCLAGLPTGNYRIELLNATADGMGAAAGGAYVQLYGASTGNPIDEHQYFVTQQYYDLLGRAPDQGGLDGWTNHISQCSNVSYRQPNETYGLCVVRTRVEVSAGFWYSDEMRLRYPGLRSPAGTTPDFNNREFARLCHVLYLQRDPTQSESDYWAAELDADADYRDAMKAFINSDEYRMRFQPALQYPPPREWDPCLDQQESPYLEREPCYAY